MDSPYPVATRYQLHSHVRTEESTSLLSDSRRLRTSRITISSSLYFSLGFCAVPLYFFLDLVPPDTASPVSVMIAHT